MKTTIWLALALLAGLLCLESAAEEYEIVFAGPYNLSQVFFTDKTHGVVGGSPFRGPPLAWTEDGGETWNPAKLDEEIKNGAAQGLWMADAKIGWAVMYTEEAEVAGSRRQVLFKTEDGGKSWTRQKAPEIEKDWVLYGLWFDRDGKKGWINGSGPLYKTADGGQSWTRVPVDKYEGERFMLGGKPMPGNFGHPGMHVFSADHVILCGMGGIILETTDGGTTWQGRQLELKLTEGSEGAAGLGAIHFAPDGKAGWVIGGEGEYVRNPNRHAQMSKPVVFRTGDGGKTWERQTVDVRTPLRDVWAISADEAWLCGMPGYALQNPGCGYLLHTVDGGKTWKNESPLRGSLAGLFFLDAACGWAVGGAGGGVEAESVVVLIRK